MGNHAWLPTSAWSPKHLKTSVFLGIWTSLGCNRWWWWSSIVTKRWGEALQYAIRSSAWSGPARFGNWDQVNEMMVRCMVWQLNYYFKTQNYMVWRSVNFGVCSLQFLFLCFRDCMLPWAAKRCSLHPHTPDIQCGQLCSLYCIQQFLLGAFLKIRNPTKKSVVFWFQKLWILTILVYNLVIHNSWFIVRAFRFRLCAPRW